MLDPDEAGIRATKEIVEKLVSKIYLKVVEHRGEAIEPDSLSNEKIRAVLN